jgi:hypothetical protein
MVKVLIYSSKEMYDNAPFEGRAEADVIAYRIDKYEYRVLKNRTGQYIGKNVLCFHLERIIERAEREEWQIDKERHELKERYKDHPYIELMKNDV